MRDDTEDLLWSDHSLLPGQWWGGQSYLTGTRSRYPNSNFLQNSGEIKMKISPAFFVLCVWELQQLDREEGGGGFLFRIIIFGGLFPFYNPRTVFRWDWNTVYSSSVLFHSRLKFTKVALMQSLTVQTATVVELSESAENFISSYCVPPSPSSLASNPIHSIERLLVLRKLNRNQ